MRTYVIWPPGNWDAEGWAESRCTGCCGTHSAVVLAALSNKSARLTDWMHCSAALYCWGNSPLTPVRPLSSFDSATGDRRKLFASETASESGLSYPATRLLLLFCDILLSSHCCIQFSPSAVQFWSETGKCWTTCASCDAGTVALAWNSSPAHVRYDPFAAVVWPSANEFGGGTISSSQLILKHRTRHFAYWCCQSSDCKFWTNRSQGCSQNWKWMTKKCLGLLVSIVWIIVWNWFCTNSIYWFVCTTVVKHTFGSWAKSKKVESIDRSRGSDGRRGPQTR